jgi:hypothetical protein
MGRGGCWCCCIFFKLGYSPVQLAFLLSVAGYEDARDQCALGGATLSLWSARHLVCGWSAGVSGRHARLEFFTGRNVHGTVDDRLRQAIQWGQSNGVMSSDYRRDDLLTRPVSLQHPSKFDS